MKNLINKLRIRLLNLYPPFLGAGVKVRKSLREGLPVFSVHMPLTFRNKNYVGTHFGGSLYSMCDPFFMLILMEELGREYLVWDKSASIQFKRPGKMTVKAEFYVTHDQIKNIMNEVEKNGKCEPEFSVDVRDLNGKLVAIVNKKLWIKKK